MTLPNSLIIECVPGCQAVENVQTGWRWFLALSGVRGKITNPALWLYCFRENPFVLEMVSFSVSFSWVGNKWICFLHFYIFLLIHIFFSMMPSINPARVILGISELCCVRVCLRAQLVLQYLVVVLLLDKILTCPFHIPYSKIQSSCQMLVFKSGRQ